MAKQQRKNRAGSSASDAADADADATSRLKPKRARTRKSAPRDQCPSQRTSAHRGVTRHRWTGRFEAHLWDKDAWSETQMNKKKTKKKGRQVYLGAYGDEEAAARAYDLAALKFWGCGTVLNFPAPMHRFMASIDALSSYDEELREMEGQSREEYIGSLRRKSTGFSRGVSKYRGVARHHHNGNWEARIGRAFGNKYLYLGTYATQEEAAVAYDIAAIQHRGLNAVTNFDLSRYIKWRHHHSSCRAGNADEGLDGTNHTPGQQLFRDLTQHPTIDLDEAMAASEGGTVSASSSSCSPSTQPPLTTQQQQQPEYTGGASSGRCSFPDDVQTYFGRDDDDHGVDFAEVDTFLFGDLGAYAPPMFQFELDVDLN